MCSVTGAHFTNSNYAPLYNPFIGETPSYGGTPARLPQFGSFKMQGQVYYNGASNSIWIPYSNLWFNEFILTGSEGTQCISVGSVDSTGSFT